MSAPARIELRGLTLHVAERDLVRTLDVRIGAGEMWCVLGANGAGKSTLLRAIAGLQRAHAGTVLFDGADARTRDPLALARLRGFMPQVVTDAFSAKVIDVVLSARHPRLSLWEWGGEEDWSVAYRALAAVGMDGFIDRDVTTLSGGERQRVAIATLLAQEVDTMLFDEPAASLDLHHQILVLGHLETLARSGRTIVYSIHDTNLAYAYSTHGILFLGDATVIQGPIRDVMTGAALSRAFKHPISERLVDGEVFFMADRAHDSPL
ncbi:MAG TPA: ABC transporter ATP-binding protein [Tahibacter sp.]|nr:ABC transporter ATP-binding protein [Tahibacter sp.]